MIASTAGWHRRGAAAKGALHQCDVDPAAEFGADRRQQANPGKPERAMEPDRRPLIAAADDGHHLPVAKLGADLDEGAKQRSPITAAKLGLVDINRIFDREAVGRTCPIEACIAEADDAPSPLRDEMGQPAAEDLAPSLGNLGDIWRGLFERRGPVET